MDISWALRRICASRAGPGLHVGRLRLRRGRQFASVGRLSGWSHGRPDRLDADTCATRSAGAGRAWPVAMASLYVALLFGVWQIHVWPLAVARHRERLADVLREAARGLLRRPVSSIAFALALLLVNAVGAAGILPVLTLTVAYSAVAAAHFVLPPPTEEAST